MISPFLILFPPKKFKTKQNLRTHFLYKNSLMYGAAKIWSFFKQYKQYITNKHSLLRGINSEK